MEIQLLVAAGLILKELIFLPLTYGMQWLFYNIKQISTSNSLCIKIKQNLNQIYSDFTQTFKLNSITLT